MAILVEGITVVFPFDYTKTKYQGGWEQFKADFPEKSSYCSDHELIAINMHPAEDAVSRLGAYLDLLEERGLVVSEGNRFVDVAVVDQLINLPEGMTCDWLTIYTARAGIPEKPVDFDLSFGKEGGILDFEEDRAKEREEAKALLEKEAAEEAARIAAEEAAARGEPVEETEAAAETEQADDQATAAAGNEADEEAEEDEEDSFFVSLSEEELAKLPKVKACLLVNGIAKGVSLPQGWDFEKSLTKAFGIEAPEKPFEPNA